MYTVYRYVHVCVHGFAAHLLAARSPIVALTFKRWPKQNKKSRATTTKTRTTTTEKLKQLKEQKNNKKYYNNKTNNNIYNSYNNERKYQQQQTSLPTKSVATKLKQIKQQ